MAPLPTDRPPTRAELAALTLDEVRADSFLSKALGDLVSGRRDDVNALTFYRYSLVPPVEGMVERLVGARNRNPDRIPGTSGFGRPNLPLSPTDLPPDAIDDLQAAVVDRNTNIMTRVVRELREAVAKRFKEQVLPDLFETAPFEQAIRERLFFHAQADPIEALLIALDAPPEKWDTLRPLLTTYRKEAIVRDKNTRPDRGLTAWNRTDKALTAMLKIVPRVKLEPVLRKHKVPFVRPLLLDLSKLARQLNLKPDQLPELKEYVDKFNRASGKVANEQVKLVIAIAKFTSEHGFEISPDEVYKRMKLAKKIY